MKKSSIYKRIMSIPVAMLIILAALIPANGITFAENGEFDPNSITTKSFALIDGDTGVLIASKNPDEKVHPSSTTKVMTALLLLENVDDLDQEVTVGAEVNPFNEVSHSLMGLKQNETVTYRELLYGMMIVSGNDAANAVGVALTEKKDDYNEQLDDFAKMMNDRAAELGMTNTHFVNAHGLYNENHITTARDMAILTHEAMKNETFREAVSTKEYTFKKTNMRTEELTKGNTNKLLVDSTTNQTDGELVYEYCTGIKTGYAKDDTGAMSGSLIASAEKDGKTLILAIMGDTSEIEFNGQQRGSMMRYIEGKKIFEYGFSAKSTDITTLVNGIELSAVLNGEQQQSVLRPVLTGGTAEYMGTDEEFLTELSNATRLEYEIKLDEGLAPPYTAGQQVGTVQYRLGDQDVFSCPVAVIDPSASSPVSTDSSDPANQSDPGSTNKKVANLSDNRSFMIAMLSIALMALIIIFVRVMSAPRRRRRSRKKRRRY